MNQPNELQLLKEMSVNENFLKEKYSELRKDYPDEFVAIKNGEVKANAPKVKILMKKLKEKGIDSAFVIIEFIHKKGTLLIL
jgi:hypothetical protein